LCQPLLVLRVVQRVVAGLGLFVDRGVVFQHGVANLAGASDH
jgi:hypothetical protein